HNNSNQSRQMLRKTRVSPIPKGKSRPATRVDNCINSSSFEISFCSAKAVPEPASDHLLQVTWRFLKRRGACDVQEHQGVFRFLGKRFTKSEGILWSDARVGGFRNPSRVGAAYCRRLQDIDISQTEPHTGNIHHPQFSCRKYRASRGRAHKTECTF